MKVIPVSVKHEQKLRLRNHTSNATVFNINRDSSNRPPFTTFQPYTARIGGEETFEIMC